MLLLSARSMEEIEGIGFEYDADECKLKCMLCDPLNSKENIDKATITSGEFKYSASYGLVFNLQEKLSRNFINLKAHIKVYLVLRVQGHLLIILSKS